MTTRQPQILKKIDGIYHVKVNAAGKSKWISTRCDTKEEAEKVLAASSVDELSRASKSATLTQRAIGQILTGKNLTCARALEEFLRIRQSNRSIATIANNATYIRMWMKEAGVESIPPSAIKPDHIGKWINAPASRLMVGTRKHALASIRRFFDFCISNGWIVSDPSQMVEVDYSVMTHEQKEGRDIRAFTEDEVKFIIKSLKADWARNEPELFEDAGTVLFWLVAVTIAKETGLRLSDIASMEWRSFAEAGKIIVWTDKTNKRLEHAISEATQDLITEIPVNDATYLFPTQHTIVTDIKRRAGLSMQFTRLLERLKIEGKSFHSMRSYYAISVQSGHNKQELAQMLADALSIDQIRQLLGHSHSSTTKGYLGKKH